MIRRIFETVVWNADGAAAPAADAPAAPAAAAPAATLADVAKVAADGGAPAAAVDPAKPAAPAEPAKPYVPDAIPEALRGATEKETLDKLAEHFAKQPKPPEKPEGYTFTPDEVFTKRFGDLKDDPVLPLWQKVAHKIGLDPNQYSTAVTMLHQEMAEAGLIEEPVSPDAELAKLMPAEGDPKQNHADAGRRVIAALDWVKAQATRGVLTAEEAAHVTQLAVYAKGITAIEKLMKLAGSPGLQPGGNGAAGGQLSEQAAEQQALARWYPTMVPKAS